MDPTQATWIGPVFWISIIAVALFALKKNNQRRAMRLAAFNGLGSFEVTRKIVATDNALAIDTVSGQLCLVDFIKGETIRRIVNKADIMKVELYEDGVTVQESDAGSMVGRAIVGDLLLGPVGAIMGGLSGKKTSSGKVSRMDLRLVVHDIQRPTFQITIITKEMPRKSKDYQAWNKYAREWVAMIEVLMRQHALASAPPTLPAAANPLIAMASVADELTKLAQLRTDGVLTDAEFQQQKQRLLS